MSAPPPASLTVLSGNLLAGGIGRSRTETRFEPLLRLAADLRADIAAFQEALYWDEDDQRLLHEAEQLLNMRGFLAPGRRAQHAGGKDHPAVVWIDPTRITVVGHVKHSSGIWWQRHAGACSCGRAHAEPGLRTHERRLPHAAPGRARGPDHDRWAARHRRRRQQRLRHRERAEHDDEQRRAHAHRATCPDQPDRAAARLLEMAGLVEVHTHVSTRGALRFTEPCAAFACVRDLGGTFRYGFTAVRIRSAGCLRLCAGAR